MRARLFARATCNKKSREPDFRPRRRDVARYTPGVLGRSDAASITRSSTLTDTPWSSYRRYSTASSRSEVEAWYRYNTFLFVSRQRLDSLPETLRATALDDEAKIPRVEPIAYRLRCELIRRLPQRSVDAMARFKHYAVSKARGSAPG